MNGADNFQTYLAHIVTAVGELGSDSVWQVVPTRAQ